MAGIASAFLLAIGPARGIAVIDLIAVDASARRQGFGAACVHFLASMEGVTRLRVGTQAANIGSLRFYEALGFRMVASHYVLHLHRM
jgi:ribosomal protein S18 acetylase RimI-like enzyme